MQRSRSAYRIKLVTTLLGLLIVTAAHAQSYKYIDSSKVFGLSHYKASVKADADKQLVEIKRYVPGIVLDVRYATSNNFMGRPMYGQAKAFARLPVAKALQQVQTQLKQRGLGLKIFDAYRPYRVTVDFYETARDTTYVADPRKGSRHNRGCAIDLTLIDLKTGSELAMPTGYDSFSKEAAADFPITDSTKLANRELLKGIMQRNGFGVYPSEWWHYDFIGWQNFELLDIPFEKL